ncbi:asparaginyl-tRNA synthetase [Algibacter lectus]|uniref:Asparagine--tRNA ligase n=1 Tax=Algibacter lectus TaxID=221126 RepID=A0A090WRF9_9FLAO|nr:asparaginyl-tRNA synthetase [Algibacter lectus]
MRLRSSLSFAIHKYFNENGFYYMHAPIITGSDAEGAGEMFKVSSLDNKNLPLTEDGKVDYTKDFFGKETNLTVSGQLEAETYAMSLGKVYTFGPTFRAENSNTSRHLAEFWMIEPEVAFMDLAGNMDLAEDFMKSVITHVLEHNREDLEFLEKRLLDEEKVKPQAERSDMSLIEKLNFVTENNFKRVSYTEAIDILRNSKPNKKKKFKYLVEEWGGMDLQSEHERFLVEKHFKCPVILFDYPADIKAFYMRLNDDGKTVRAMDILFPGIGEIVGGAQREERLDILKQRMAAIDIPEEDLWWYMDLRKYGTAVHSGFGLGFERLVMFATGMGNIRDVIPFPRTPQNAEF